MQAKKSKPYFIELFSKSSLQNKFKFVLSASTVKELKNQIKDKLVGKKEMDGLAEITIKDADDYELASDDEVQDVVPDGKVKVYLKSPNVPQIVPPATSTTSLSSQPSQSASKLPSSNLAKDISVIDLSTFSIPAIPESSKHKLTLHIPQIRKTAITIPFDVEISSHLEFSKLVISTLGLSQSLKAILYNRNGAPFIYNLDLMHLPLPKLDLAQPHFVVLTATPSTVDQQVKAPALISNNATTIYILKNDNKFKVEIDLENTLEALKYRIFEITRIHPKNQTIKFAKTILENNIEVLRTYNIVENSILELSFKLTCNLVPSTFADKFFYKDITHVVEQSEESVVNLRSHLLILASHLQADDKVKMPVFLRAYSNNMPLVFALKLLFNVSFVSQTHRIALEEGLLAAIVEFIQKCTSGVDKIESKDVFTNIRPFLSYLLEGMSKITNFKEVEKTESTVQIHRNCHFTMKPIKNPRLLKLDDQSIVLVDKDLMQEHIQKGFTYDTLKTPNIGMLYSTKQLEYCFETYLQNLVDNQNTNSVLWTGYQDKAPQLQIPKTEALEKYLQRIDSYPNAKIYQSLEIKNKNESYLMMRDKSGKLKVFVSRNKDISKPYNLFYTFTGQEEAVNLDLMSANVTTESVEECINVADLKPTITRDPKEAIMVLFDISGSMGSYFFNEKDLKRIGAVKSFFEAFAYRTIAYNLQHVVSLVFFDNRIDHPCGFTESIYDFNRLVANANPRSSTLMYDAMMYAVKQLTNFKIKYPNCRLRILALTDGQDSGSKASIQQVATELVHNEIVIDSFAVGANCQGLKVITKATGGRCYLTRNLQESLKLFEQETVLSVRARKAEDLISKLGVLQRINQARSMPFDLPSNIHEFKMPESSGGFSAKDMIKKMEKEDKQISGSGSLKRIAKEIQIYSDNPHPFVSIYPCSNINLWKILLVGPKQTPYENGLFTLYAQFPGDYPFKAPEVRFVTPIYHCNMNSQGRICHSVFDRNYSPALTFRQIIDCVYGLILTPQPEDPLDNVIASFYLSEYQTYLKNAKEATIKSASPTIQKVVDDLFGKIVDDVERKKTEKEIEEWIEMAKSFN